MMLHHDANCLFFFKKVIIENFLIFQNIENRIRIPGKFSLPHQTVPYSHHVSSAYPTTHRNCYFGQIPKRKLGTIVGVGIGGG